MSDQFLGEIRPFANNFAPYGWAQCNGQLLPISQYAALFSLLGTAYGGNGTSNFGLPNIAGTTLYCQGQGPGLSPYVMGETGGEETVTLISSEMPMHNHTFDADTGTGPVERSSSTSAPTANVSLLTSGLAKNTSSGNNPTNGFTTAPTNVTMAPNMLGTAGSSQPHQNMSPFITINYCIALQGVFPARN